ncbi:hypothetical protein LEP1GSC133_1676 [Leptospira borgpetersenii serovar Pomona str. 200901868]|uniref:Uncharacterized protein n=1 Tax=Leptospira borgpetersenii serovar Pomona str. 200901868 TaxID=1192866 RepID=M6VYS0_LEPBO|nr:hypothetical protein LEP1GSC133_1676 [Leptospira borgpetersenii serovar Pomona str. 200901868]
MSSKPSGENPARFPSLISRARSTCVRLASSARGKASGDGTFFTFF